MLMRSEQQRAGFHQQTAPNQGKSRARLTSNSNIARIPSSLTALGVPSSVVVLGRGETLSREERFVGLEVHGLDEPKISRDDVT